MENKNSLAKVFPAKNPAKTWPFAKVSGLNFAFFSSRKYKLLKG